MTLAQKAELTRLDALIESKRKEWFKFSDKSEKAFAELEALSEDRSKLYDQVEADAIDILRRNDKLSSP